MSRFGPRFSTSTATAAAEPTSDAGRCPADRATCAVVAEGILGVHTTGFSFLRARREPPVTPNAEAEEHSLRNLNPEVDRREPRLVIQRAGRPREYAGQRLPMSLMLGGLADSNTGHTKVAFNPRPPRGATCDDGAAESNLLVSIHAPPRGATPSHQLRSLPPVTLQIPRTPAVATSSQ